VDGLAAAAPRQRSNASQGHRTKEFRELVTDLFGAGPYPEYEPSPRRILAVLLNRAGYYRAVIESNSTRPIRQLIADKIQYGRRERSSLWLLGRCRFASPFQLFGLSVERFSYKQLVQMNAAPENHAGGEDEREMWFLVQRDVDVLPDGWVGRDEWEEIDSNSQ